MVPQQFNRFPPQNSSRTPAPTSTPRPVAQNFRNPAPTNPNLGNNQQNTQRVCYSCHQPGHFTNQCPQKGTITPVRFNLGATPAKTLAQNNQGVSQATSQPGGAPQSVVRGRVNHVILEGAQEAPDVVLGKSLVNSVPASALFDSGASHSFVFGVFATKNNLEVMHLKHTLLVQLLGVEISSKVGCLGAKLLIGGVEFLANLIVLDTQTLDVILGMD